MKLIKLWMGDISSWSFFGVLFLISIFVTSAFYLKRKYCFKKRKRAPVPPPRPLFTLRKELSVSSEHTSNWSASYITPEVISCDNCNDSRNTVNCDINQPHTKPKMLLKIVQEEFEEELEDSCVSVISSSSIDSMELACSNSSQLDTSESIHT